MSVEVRVPVVLRNHTGGSKVVRAEGDTVGAMLEDLDRRYPGFKGGLFDDEGEVRRFVNIYVNDEDIRFLNNLDTRLGDGDVVSILPAVAGGVVP